MTRMEQVANTATETLRRGGRFSREAAAGYERDVIVSTNVIVAGAGALGQFLMLCLALIGYPRVTCIDMDHFEESNATRSPFYRGGSAKAEAVAAGARAMCTATTDIVYRFAVGMIQSLGDAIFTGPGRTVVLSAVDSQPARVWLAQRSRKLGVLLVEGGFFEERWNVSAFRNDSDTSPCWACGMEEIETGRIFSCHAYATRINAGGIIPATAPGAMGLAAFQVGLLTQLLHGNCELADSTLAVDLHRAVVRRMRRTTDPACRVDHRIVAGDSVKIASGPEDTAATLIQEVAGLVSDPIIHLPAPFVRVAPCHQCHHSMLVEQPEWALQGPPCCRRCGGEFRQTRGLPEQHGMLSAPTSERILDTALEKLGLGPGLHLTVEGQREQITVVLAGDVDSVLMTAGEEVINHTEDASNATIG